MADGMKIYLVRHAHAIDGEDDAARPLSARGNAYCLKLAAALRAGESPEPMPIFHSRLVRAKQTATLLAQGLGWSRSAPRQMAGLEPEADPFRSAELIEKMSDSFMLVGHDPHIGALASLLVSGKAHAKLFNLKKGAVLCLRRTKHQHKKLLLSRWSVRWLLSPDFVSAGRSSKGRDDGA